MNGNGYSDTVEIKLVLADSRDHYALCGITDQTVFQYRSYLLSGEEGPYWFVGFMSVKIYNANEQVIDHIRYLCRECNIEIEIQ